MGTARSGSFVWYDLSTSDVEGAKSFYTALIGWDLQAFEAAPADDPYTMWVGPQGPLGGVVELVPEAKQKGLSPHWRAYTLVDNVDTTIAQCAELGGKTAQPATQIPNGGRFAALLDPFGTVFGVVEGQPEATSPAPGLFSWHELMTPDATAAFAFYAKLFGWQKTEAMEMPGGMVYQMYGNGGESLGGIFRTPPPMQGQAGWLYYIQVDDCDEGTERAKSLGAALINGPMDVPGGGRISQLRDPQGAMFALHWMAT